MSVRVHSLLLMFVPLAFGALGAGCKCGRDKPYVPYSIEAPGDAAASAASSFADAAVTQPLADAGPEPLALVRASADGRTLPLESMTVAAPAAQLFVAGTTFDWDNDGMKDAAVLLRAEAAGPGPTYAVALYRGGRLGGAPTVVASSSPLAPCGSQAEVPVKMTKRGKSSLVIEVGATCASRTPARWLLVVATEGKSPRARFSMGIADPPGAHPLIVEADAIDKDADGIDDVLLRASLEGAASPFEPGPRVTGNLVWLDRSAGLSRDPEEPEASFRAITAPLATRAMRAKEAPLVPVAVRQLRHLAHALCAEGGAARIVQLAGATLPACAGSRALEEAGFAEARAHATQGDPLRAALAFDRAQRPPASKTPAKLKEATLAIEKVAGPLDATQARMHAAVPDEPPREVPSFGPLAFEADGHLLIKTRAGVVRADPATGEEADAGRAPWSFQVGGNDGRPEMVMAMNPCDGVALRGVFSGPDAQVLLPIVPPLGERCVVPRGEPALVRPLAWGPSGLEVIVGGEPILVASLGGSDTPRASLLAAPLDAPGPVGSAKSPDGSTVVVPSNLGLVVRTKAGTRLHRARDFEPYADLRHCAVSNDAKRVACTKGKRVVAGIWER